MNIIPLENTTVEELNLLVDEIDNKIGDGIEITINILESIEYKKNCKFSFVNQKLNIENYIL